MLVSGCTATSARTESDRIIVARAAFPVALTSDGSGRLLYAERLTGRVRRVDDEGRLEPLPVAQVAVSTAGQRGLLGLAVDPTQRIFVAFTSAGPDRPIEVAQVVPTFRVVWTGPASSSLANGAHLAYDPERRRLVIGIGDLQDRAKSRDPATPNGKLLVLDPDGPPSQTPVVLSQGWNNPFAFTLTTSGAVWVADNVPGQSGERLARGDLGGRPSHVTDLPDNTVPTGLAAPTDHSLVVCSFTRRRTLHYEIRSGDATRTSGFGDGARCQTGITARGRKVLWLATEHSLRQRSAR